MGCGVGHLDYAHDSIPRFADMRMVNGATHLQIRVVVGEWFKRAVPWTFLGFFVAGAGVVVLAFLLRGAGAPWRWLPMIGGVLWLLALFAGFILFALSMAGPQIKGEAVVDSQKLRLTDRGNGYEFPLGQIHSLRHVVYPGSRLEMDLGRPPSELFFRGRRTALEVRVPEGQVEFFHFFEEDKVAWMAENVSRLVFPDRPPVTPEAIDASESTSQVIASKQYGKQRRMMIRGTLFIGSLATLASGWYACRGLSSLAWPSVQGRVISSHYEETQGSRGDPHYEAEVKYSYEVLGSKYTNDDIGFMRTPSDDVVKELVAKHPAGAPITVYYDRSRPAMSIVIPGLGPLYWLLVGVSLVPLLVGINWARSPTSLQQDALAARYRVVMTALAKAWERHLVRIRWSAPSDAWQIAIRRARRRGFWVAIRMFGATALAVWAAHHWVEPLIPWNVPWRIALSVPLGLVGLLIIGQLIENLLRRPKPPEYGLSDEGLLFPSKEKPLIPWTAIVGFNVEPEKPSFPMRAISLHLKSGLQAKVPLPGGEADERIVSEVSSRIPEGQPPKRFSPLTGRDWAIGTSIAVAVSSLGYFLNWPAGQPLPMPRVFLLCIVAGPGTWMAVALRARRAGLGSLAVGLNMLTAIGLLLFAIARALVELHR